MTFEVEPADLYTHGTALDGLGSSLTTASEASDVSGDAFGVICAFLNPWVNSVQTGSVELITQVGTTTADLAESIRGAAADYEIQDAEIAYRFELLTQACDG